MNLIAFQTNALTNNAVSLPVHIVSPYRLIKNPETMTKFDSFDYLLEVQKNLIAEEEQEYRSSLKSESNLAQIFNSSVFNASIAKILQKSLLPMYEFIQEKLAIDKKRLEQVLAENAELSRKLQEKCLKSQT